MIAIGSIIALGLRVSIPWSGAWIAEVDLDLPASSPLPTGRVTITLESEFLSGTVEDRLSGRFGEKAVVTVVGGGNGWGKLLAREEFHNDAGLLMSTVRAATAALVEETLEDDGVLQVAGNGVDWVRRAGPASGVLPIEGWYLDALGVTHIAQRTNTPASSSIEVLSWDPATQTAELASDGLVWPGTIISSSLIGVDVVAREVELSIAGNRSRVTASCGSEPSTRIAAALRSAVVEFAGVQFAKLYRYRIQTAGSDRRLTCQAVTPNEGMPDVVTVPPWPGMSGLDAEYPLGTVVLLSFVEGPDDPVIVGWEKTTGSSVFLAKAPTVQTALDALKAFANTTQTAATVPAINAAAVTLWTALGGILPSPTTYEPVKTGVLKGI